MKNFVKKFSFLAAMALLVVSLLPSVTSASTVKTDVVAKIMGEVNVLNLVKAGGKCDKIYVKVRVKELEKVVDLKTLNLSLKYDVYHNIKGKALEGKIVGTGEVTAKQKGDYFEIVYDPTANPNGPAGNYAFKIYLALKGKKSKHALIVNVKINEPCKGDNNGGANNGGTTNGGTNNGGTNNGGTTNGGTNNGGTNNGGTTNGGTNNGGTNNGGTANAGQANAGTVKPNGGKLPKTANSFANTMAVGVALTLAGVGALAYRRRESL